ncbi:type VII secretion protein EccB [Micromonospora sp. WMMB482]|uniref:type VII secretion protein EccB n=1 Tax=Micromonospora sp. WMMB482 TaxID=2849653 RepID=UPI0020B2607A|nr:type VII secretion protein EccB [Micromonospora sp. WMMB482]
MSQASIKDRPRGRLVGIVGAPDDLPDRRSLAGLPWSVCDVPNPNDPQRSSTHLVIDRALPGGTALTDRAVVVRTSDARYLLTGGSRLRVAGDEQALVALKMAGATNLTVGQQLLNAVPVGPDLRKPAIAGDGGASGLTVAGRPARIGQVYQAAGQYYVLTRRGLATVREVTALLLLGGGGEVTQITPTRRAGSSPTSAWTRTACRPGCRRCTRSVRGGRCSAPPTGPARPVSHRQPRWRSSTPHRPS